ncbi:MAG: TauD/TfdA family dioxygenase [Alphaproteobacteria bacterium]|nr:TauD/TfdA family dioxygenase [Alphaproteobacteria bacterium]
MRIETAPGRITGVRPLAPAIGAEIEGLDLAQPLDDSTFEEVRAAWHQHGILLFRGQRLDEDQELAFASRFGPIAPLVTKHDVKFKPGVMLVSNIRENGKEIGVLPDGEMFFHSDQCYAETPLAATILYAIEIPKTGGNTLFSNQYAAYDALPEEVKRRIAGLKAMNVYDYGSNATIRKGSLRAQAERGEVPCYAHPIVRTHPETGRKALFLNRLMTDYVVGMDPDDSDRLLDYLFTHQEDRRFVYEHVWRIGDLMMWDNRCTLHARTDFPTSERRLLRRVIVQGDKPY